MLAEAHHRMARLPSSGSLCLSVAWSEMNGKKSVICK